MGFNPYKLCIILGFIPYTQLSWISFINNVSIKKSHINIVIYTVIIIKTKRKNTNINYKYFVLGGVYSNTHTYYYYYDHYRVVVITVVLFLYDEHIYIIYLLYTFLISLQRQ